VSGNKFCKFTYLKGLHRHPVPPAAYRVLVTVLDYTNERGEMAYARVGRLAADCCMNERTVKRHLAWLREHGYLTRTKRGRRVGNVGLASEYSLALPVLQCVTADTLDDDFNVATGDPKVSIGDPKVSIGVPQGVTADTPSDPVSDPSTSDPSTSDPPGDDSHCRDCEEWGTPCARCTTAQPVLPPSRPNRIPTERLEHDSADEYLPDDCFDCRYWNRACGRVREPALATVGAAEPDWGTPIGPHWAEDDPPWG
jgi:Helix-turn-helix domain